MVLGLHIAHQDGPGTWRIPYALACKSLKDLVSAVRNATVSVFSAMERRQHYWHSWQLGLRQDIFGGGNRQSARQAMGGDTLDGECFR
jgi:hypothetical protein